LPCGVVAAAEQALVHHYISVGVPGFALARVSAAPYELRSAVVIFEAPLVGDAMRGDRTLFGSEAGVEAALRVVDPILGADALPDEYEVGSSGLASAEALATSVGGWIAPRVVTRSINAGSYGAVNLRRLIVNESYQAAVREEYARAR